jgi:hypothetical protein
MFDPTKMFAQGGLFGGGGQANPWEAKVQQAGSPTQTWASNGAFAGLSPEGAQGAGNAAQGFQKYQEAQQAQMQAQHAQAMKAAAAAPQQSAFAPPQRPAGPQMQPRTKWWEA